MKKTCLVTLFAAYALLCAGQTGLNGYGVSYTAIAPRPDLPARLEVPDMMFTDRTGNNNNILDAYERGEIVFYLGIMGRVMPTK